METPSPQDARRTLGQLSNDARAVRYPPLPWWFFLAQATLLAAVFLAQLLPADDTPEAMFAVAVCALVLGGRYWIYRDRVSGVTPSLRDMLPFLGGVLGTLVACLVVTGTTDAWWIWIAGAVVAGGIVLRTGSTYARTHGHG